MWHCSILKSIVVNGCAPPPEIAHLSAGDDKTYGTRCERSLSVLYAPNQRADHLWGLCSILVLLPPKWLVDFGKFNVALVKVGWGFYTQHLRVFWWRLRGNCPEINGPLWLCTTGAYTSHKPRLSSPWTASYMGRMFAEPTACFYTPNWYNWLFL